MNAPSPSPALASPVREIDATPTWEAILPIIRATLENGKSPSVREVMWAELLRMARAADAYNAQVRT